MMTQLVKYGLRASIPMLVMALVSCEKPPTPPSAEVNALHQERIKTLRELVQLIEARNEDGSAPTTNVLQAQRNLLTAQLEATPAQAERIALRESLLKNLKQFEQQVNAQVESGTAPLSNLLEVRASRIKAEIELAREKD